MKKMLLLTVAFALLVAACSKDDDNPPPTPTPMSVNGKFTVSFDSTRFAIDSLRGYYLNAGGTLDSTTLRGVYSWESPARRYDQADTGYARVFAWGSTRVSGSEVPSVKFSETFSANRFSSGKGNSQKDGKTGFQSFYGFRY